MDYPVKKLLSEFDAVCVSGGSRIPRDLKIEGRQLGGIYFAMDYLAQSNKRVAGQKIPEDKFIDARGKKVWLSAAEIPAPTAWARQNRQGAKSVVQIEVIA